MDINSKDEEYKFPETGSTNAFGVGQPKANLQEKFKRRTIFIVIAIIVIVIVLFKLLGGSHKVVKVEPVAPKPIAKTLDVVQPKLPGLGMTDTQTRLANNEARIAELENGLTSLVAQMTTMTDAIKDLSMQVARQEDAMRVARTVKKKPKVVHAPKAVNLPVYYIKALVPGRAWLVSADGATLTVGSGDALPGYGVVQDIDPTQGLVTSSSGRVLTYSESDR